MKYCNIPPALLKSGFPSQKGKQKSSRSGGLIPEDELFLNIDHKDQYTSKISYKYAINKILFITFYKGIYVSS